MAAEGLIGATGLPARVRGVSTTRTLAGASTVPYESFNLGSHVGDDAGAVAANRAALVDLAQLPSPPRYLRQVHGTTVARLDATRADEPEADASVTRAPGVVLAILTADCLPILLAARDGSVIGATHAGWRGLAAGVIERTVEAMDVAPRELVAWIGPAIGPDAYEVGRDVRAAFEDEDAFRSTRDGHWLCDLPLLARRRLERGGVTAITASNLCTHTDPRFYSYRRDGVTGRFATLAWIAP